jgi:hypothetical protein
MPLRQVYQFTKTGGTNTWSEILSGDFVWNPGETEQDYLIKLGFDPTKFFLNEPNFLARQVGFKNKLFQTLVFLEKTGIPTVANPFVTILYMRIKEKESGVMFLCEKIGDSIFLLEDVECAMNGSFQLHQL